MLSAITWHRRHHPRRCCVCLCCPLHGKGRAFFRPHHTHTLGSTPPIVVLIGVGVIASDMLRHVVLVVVVIVVGCPGVVVEDAVVAMHGHTRVRVRTGTMGEVVVRVRRGRH